MLARKQSLCNNIMCWDSQRHTKVMWWKVLMWWKVRI